MKRCLELLTALDFTRKYPHVLTSSMSMFRNLYRTGTLNAAGILRWRCNLCVWNSNRHSKFRYLSVYIYIYIYAREGGRERERECVCTDPPNKAQFKVIWKEIDPFLCYSPSANCANLTPSNFVFCRRGLAGFTLKTPAKNEESPVLHADNLYRRWLVYIVKARQCRHQRPQPTSRVE